MRTLDGAPLPKWWRLDFNYLCGITVGQWLTLLREERFAVSPFYAHRLALVTAMATMNSFFAAVERARFGSAIRGARPAPPVFVLGHYRHGTTHLHNLLAQDPRFSFPTTWMVANPSTFLTTEGLGPRLLAPLLPGTRPQDPMAMGFDLPQEDEYALALLSLASPVLAFSFPADDARWKPYLSLRDVPAADRRRWMEALEGFVRKSAVRDPRPLVLKSPAHTARVRWLLEVFPEARFVHIHRDPYTVFASTRHLFETSMAFMYLQRPDLRLRDERILEWYTATYDAWFEDRGRIGAGRLAEVRFEDLEADPIGTLEATYAELDLGDPPVDRLERYLATLRGYRKNAYAPLTAEERRRVREAWGRSFEAWGYPS